MAEKKQFRDVAEKFRLWEWVKSMKDKIEGERWTAAKLLDQARAATGIISLHEKAVRQACQATGVRLLATAEGNGGLRPWIARVQALEVRIARLESQVAAVAKQDYDAIEDLQGRLDSLEVALGVSSHKPGCASKEVLGGI